MYERCYEDFPGCICQLWIYSCFKFRFLVFEPYIRLFLLKLHEPCTNWYLVMNSFPLSKSEKTFPERLESEDDNQPLSDKAHLYTSLSMGISRASPYDHEFLTIIVPKNPWRFKNGDLKTAWRLAIQCLSFRKLCWMPGKISMPLHRGIKSIAWACHLRVSLTFKKSFSKKGFIAIGDPWMVVLTYIYHNYKNQPNVGEYTINLHKWILSDISGVLNWCWEGSAFNWYVFVSSSWYLREFLKS